MENVSASETVREKEAAPSGGPKGSSTGRWVLISVGVALAAWCGVRIRSALLAQASIEKARAEEAAHATTNGPSGPIATFATGVTTRWQPRVAIEGTLAAAREADLGFRAQGRLASIRVRLGEFVRKGAVLATLEQTENTAQVEAAKAQVRAASAQLRMTEDTERRTSSLVTSGAQSQASGVQVENQRMLATAQLDAARAQLDLASANLENTTMIAPFSGYVTKVPSGPGAIVNPGIALFHLQETTTLKLVGTIGEADAPLVRPGATVEIFAGGRKVEGTVTAVLGLVDPATRRVPIEASVKNEGPAPVLAGTFVRAEVGGVGAVEVVRLPAGALRSGSQDEVMVVEGGRLHARRIQFSTAEDGALMVRSGLEAKETVLVGAPAEAKEGDPAPQGVSVAERK